MQIPPSSIDKRIFRDISPKRSEISHDNIIAQVALSGFPTNSARHILSITSKSTRSQHISYLIYMTKIARFYFQSAQRLLLCVCTHTYMYI